MPDPQGAPGNDASRGQVLMSAENPDGWRLEELLPQLRAELFAKTQRIADDARPVAGHVRANNLAVIGLLAQAEAFVRDSLTRMAAIASDAGPRGTPRIGPGSPGFTAAQELSGSRRPGAPSRAPAPLAIRSKVRSPPQPCVTFVRGP